MGAGNRLKIMAKRNPGNRPGTMHVFVDGQNLFKSANRAFGHEHPNFDIMSLARGLADAHRCELKGVHFYSGMPGARENPKWHDFWARKLVDMGRAGIELFTPPLRYQTHTEILPDGRTKETYIGREKGVDVRIALDMMKHALFNSCDNMMVVSRDNDLAEAAKEARLIARSNDRFLDIWSAYPSSKERPQMGIRDTRWMPLDAEFYNAHLDRRDYFRPRLEENRRPENSEHAKGFSGKSTLPSAEIVVARAEKASQFLHHGHRSQENQNQDSRQGQKAGEQRRAARP